MTIHVTRRGTTYPMTLSQQSSVRVFPTGHLRYANGRPSIIIGTLPNLNVIPLDEIDHIWVEED